MDNLKQCLKCDKLFDNDNYIKHINRYYPCNNYCVVCKTSFANSLKYIQHIDNCAPRQLSHRYLLKFYETSSNDILSLLSKNIQLCVYREIWYHNVLKVNRDIFEDMEWFDNGDDLQCYVRKSQDYLNIGDFFMYQYPYAEDTDNGLPFISRWDRPHYYRTFIDRDDDNWFTKPKWCLNKRLDDLGPVVTLNIDKLAQYGVTWTNSQMNYYSKPIRI